MEAFLEVAVFEFRRMKELGEKALAQVPAEALHLALESLRPGDLDRRVTIRGEPHTVLQAIGRQLTHYSYHVGQMVLLARHLAGPEWRWLSIPPSREGV